MTQRATGAPGDGEASQRSTFTLGTGAGQSLHQFRGFMTPGGYKKMLPQGGREGNNKELQDKPLPPEYFQELAGEEQQKNPDHSSPADAAPVLAAGASCKPNQEPSAPGDMLSSKPQQLQPQPPPAQSAGAP